MSTDAEWERWGSENPYFGVLTAEEFRSERLTEEARQKFFRTGREQFGNLLQKCRDRIDPEFTPRRALEFGCGVGRLTIPLAGVAEQVVGLDISPSMLEEARKNCSEHGRDNVQLLQSDDELSALDGRFDFLLSWIVFQHIPTDRGVRIFARLLDHLNPGGVGVVQFKYARPRDFEPTDDSRPGLGERANRKIRQWLHRAPVTRSSSRDPEMQMNAYDLNRLVFMLQSAGVSEIHAETEDHGGEWAVCLYFRIA